MAARGGRHLTDFSGFTDVTIDVASGEEMLSLSPNDIVTKLKVVCAVVFGLFGAMHLVAWLAWVSDQSGRAALLQRMKASAHICTLHTL